MTSLAAEPTTLHVMLSTASSAATTSTQSVSPSTYTYPAATGSTQEPVHDAAVINYYFLFLALFGVLVAGILWWRHMRRKRQKQQRRLSGQHALARDVEGWGGARRFMHGRYGRHQNTARVRHIEGLDENGEAPPPYEPKHEVTVEAMQDTSGLAVPLRTLARVGPNRMPPPDYHGLENARANLPAS